MRSIIVLLLLLVVLCSCKESERDRKERLVNEWNGREIAFPSRILCMAGEDTVEYKIPNSDLLVVTYADSSGCVNFRKQLSKWKQLIARTDSFTRSKVAFVFFLRPSDVGEIRYILHQEEFKHPVCYDIEDKLHALNKFPEDPCFRSFLLDRSRQVVAIGNPATDSEVENVYTKIIEDGGIVTEPQDTRTTVNFENHVLDLEEFDWQKPQHLTLSIKNTGDKMFVIDDVISSSSSVYVEYNYGPVPPGKKWELYIRYTADSPESFNHDITVYCNAESSPLSFKLIGNAK